MAERMAALTGTGGPQCPHSPAVYLTNDMRKKLKPNTMVIFMAIVIALGFAALLYYGARIMR